VEDVVIVIAKIVCVDCGTSSDILNCSIGGMSYELCSDCVDSRNDNNEETDEEG